MVYSTHNNMASLSSLPPPPKGKTGISLDQFKHLPPPPAGKTGMTLAQIQANTQSEPSLGSRISSDINKSGESAYNAIAGEGQYAGESPIRRGAEAAFTTLHTPLQVGYELLPKQVRDGLSTTGKALSQVMNMGRDNQAQSEPVTINGVPISKDITNDPKLQKWTQDHPEAYKALTDVLGTTQAVGGIAGDILAEQGVANNLQKVADVGAKVVKGTGDMLKGTAKGLNRAAIDPSTSEAGVTQAYKGRVRYLERQLGNATKGTPEYEDISSKLDDLKANAPTLSADSALKRNITGTEKNIGIEAKAQKLDLWDNKIQPALKGVGEKMTTDEMFAKAEERIASEVDPSRKISLQNALDSIKEDYAKTPEFSLEDANKIKSGLDKFTPAKIFKGQDVASELKTIKADMATAIRQKTYDVLQDEGIKSAYRDYANLGNLEKIGIHAMTGAGTRAGFGNFWSTIKDQATIPVYSIGSQVLYRVGNLLEFIGDKGIKTLGQHLDNIGVNIVPGIVAGNLSKSSQQYPDQQGQPTQ